mgnify:FL=1
MPTPTPQLATPPDALADEAAADAGNEGYEAHFAGLVASDNPYATGVREAKAWDAGRLQARQDAREMAA